MQLLHDVRDGSLCCTSPPARFTICACAAQLLLAQRAPTVQQSPTEHSVAIYSHYTPLENFKPSMFIVASRTTRWAVGHVVSHSKREVGDCDIRRLGVELRPTFWAYHPVLAELPAPGYSVQRSPAHPLAGNCCDNEFAGSWIAFGYLARRNHS